MEEEKKTFMGYELAETGEIDDSIPVLKSFGDELRNRIIQEGEAYVYKQCLQLEIDPHVLEKQLIEIKRLNFVINQKDRQIEKMKNCRNCEHEYDWEDNDYCVGCLSLSHDNKPKWELRK